jgi:hypothetical protein
MKPLGESTLRWARAHLEPSVVRDVVAPTVADLRLEHAAASAEDAIVISQQARSILTRAVVGALWLAACRRASRTPWWLLIAPAAVLVFAAQTLVLVSPQQGSQHAWFGAVAMVLAVALSLWPTRSTPAAHGLAAGLVVAALGAVAVSGTSAGGLTRWLSLGPLTVHVAGLLTPLFVVLMLDWTPSRAWLRPGFAAACLGALVMQPNLPICALWAAVAVASSQPRQRRAMIPLTLAALALCVGTTPAGGVTPSLTGIVPASTGSYNATWTLLVMLGLWVPACFAWRRLPSTRVAAHRLDTYAALFALWPMLAYLDEGLVLLSFGGSMVVAYVACVGMLMRDVSVAAEA